MINYLENVIVQSMNLEVDGGPKVELTPIPPLSKGGEIYSRLSTDNNAIACKKQLHSSNHNAVGFEYSQRR